jgi:adenylyltransferase/sulfurtransferase
MEAVKVLLGIGEPLVGRLLLFSGLDMTWNEAKVFKDPNCAVCGGGSS